MEEKKSNIDFLISRALTGEATSKQLRELEEWINSSKVNKKYFSDIKFVHDKSVAFHARVDFNVDLGWKSLQVQMKQLKPEGERRYIYRTNWLKLAASIFLIISIGSILTYFIWKSDKAQIVSVTAKVSSEKLTLVDKSEVVLNTSSNIQYDKDFGKKNRKVKLTGEAYFKVEHKTDLPFIVNTQDVFIKDIGTEFNIKSIPTDSLIAVTVLEGSVRFYTLKDDGIRITRGETGYYYKKTKKIEKGFVSDPNVISYKTKVFEFDNCKLNEALQRLNAVYNVNIILANANISNCRITVRFDEETIDNIVKIIAETLDLQVSHVHNTYVLNGNPCTYNENE